MVARSKGRWNLMKAVVQSLVDDFHDRELPDLIAREIPFRMIKGKASVVVGMRRSGKTSFCLHYLRKLMSDGLDRDRMLYLSFEDERLLGFKVEDFQSILDVYYARFPRNKRKKCYFVLDEIQRVDGWESFARRVVDTENIQLILTGSSAKLLSREIATAFRGRSIVTEIFPLSFSEFISWHGVLPEIPTTFGSGTVATLRHEINRYFTCGGFPEVQDCDLHTRNEILQNYVDAVLFRDIIERSGLGNVMALRFMIKTIMNAPGQKFSVTKFSNTLATLGVKCSRNDLYLYLDGLADAFLVFRVPLHTQSAQIQRVNPDKIYAIDTGLIHALAHSPDAGRGLLLENLVFLHLRRQGYEIEYLNTREGYEVDFLARRRGVSGGRLIQVAFDVSDGRTLDREVRALRSAGEQFKDLAQTLVTWDHEKTLDGIHVVPAWKFLLQVDEKTSGSAS